MSDNAPRLMLVSPVLPAGDDFLTSFEAALGAAPFAAVILRADREADERAVLRTLKPLVEAAQAKDAAVLIEGAPDLVGKSGADGIHTLGETQAREALDRFKPEKIVGVGGLRTRDAAMAVGEKGADYVLFGDPGKGGDVPFDAVTDKLAWWAEIFTTPCVGQAETPDAAASISASGCDFVAIGSFVWTDARGPAEAVRSAAAAIAAEAVA